jgi:uncharacterized membrane protein
MDTLNKFDESTILRLSFIFTGSFLLYAGFQDWIKGDPQTHPWVLTLILATYLLAFALFILALTSGETPFKVKHIILPALIFIVVFNSYVTSEIFYKGVYRTDAIALTHYAALRFMESRVNPYTLDLQEALIRFPVEPQYITFTETGDLITTLNYPSLHFLIYVPFIALGLNDMRWVTVLFEALTFTLLYWRTPRTLRPLALIPLFASVDLVIDFTAGCVTDYLWVLPLTATVLFIDNLPISAISFGLACAVKQEPWLLAPFLLTWMWMESLGDWKRKLPRTGTYGGLALASFLLPNWRFIVEDPAAWWNGVFSPVFGGLIVQSQGVSMLTQMGYVPLGKGFYLVVTLSVYILLAVNYTVYYDKLKYTFWIYPAVTLWFSYRGLQSYFIHLIPVVTAAAVAWYRRQAVEGGV